jgi:nucleotide-binding universal stress UspA family protein
MNTTALNENITLGDAAPTLDYIQQILKLKTLLVPTDFSECSQKAIHYAEELARQFGSTIVLLHVVEPVHPYPVDGLGSFPGEQRDVNLELLPEAAESMEKLAALVGRSVATPVRHLTRIGSAHEEIVRIAAEQNADLIVISTHGRTGWKRFLMGSTAELVVRHAPCPVFVVREKEHDFA